MQGYGIVNVLYEFLDAPSVTVSGVSIEDEGEDFWGEFGGGLTYSFSEAWTIYGEGSYRTSSRTSATATCCKAPSASATTGKHCELD